MSRWPAEFVERRLSLEDVCTRRLINGRDPIRRVAETILSASGLTSAGRINALDLRLEQHQIALPGLPESLHGYRILQLSDLHIPESGDEQLLDGILKLASQTPHDLAVLTGDYRDRSFGPFDTAMSGMRQIRAALGDTAVAILGNHDSLSSVEPLESSGYHVLVNETLRIDHQGAAFDLLGIDDPAYFGLHDLDTCLAASTTPFQILLSHSPDSYAAAEKLGIDALLCGHTHGGQLCLPGGIAVRRNSSVPGSLISGSWRSGQLQGYTSRGAGTSIINARFFCPPELTLHTLITA